MFFTLTRWVVKEIEVMRESDGKISIANAAEHTCRIGGLTRAQALKLRDDLTAVLDPKPATETYTPVSVPVAQQPAPELAPIGAEF